MNDKDFKRQTTKVEIDLARKMADWLEEGVDLSVISISGLTFFMQCLHLSTRTTEEIFETLAHVFDKTKKPLKISSLKDRTGNELSDALKKLDDIERNEEEENE